MLNRGFATSSFNMVPKVKIDKRYYTKSFETNLFNMIQKVSMNKS